MAQIRLHALMGRVAAAAALAVSSLGFAQETSGRDALLAAVEAARGLRSLTAEVEMTGEGGFKSYVPTGKGTIRLLRQDEAIEGRAWHSRLDTTYVHKAGDPEEQITTLKTPESLIWIEHEKKQVIERSYNDTRSRAASALNLFALPEITAEEPYARELTEATDWRLLEPAEVNGVKCRVIEVVYDMSDPKKSRDPSQSLIRTPSSKWYFGAEDNLPRRVERISDQGMISFTIALDLKNMQINPEIDPASLVVQTPEGYTRVEPGKPAMPVAVAPRTAEKIENEKEERQPEVLPTMLPAHGFDLVDGDGNAVTLDGLKGSVTVLYFWGTWCVPCKEFSPLVSDLVDQFEGEPVRVFGLPVRERSEEAVREAMSPYKHTLLLDPAADAIGCDATARAYKVRRYPTIYVIGKESQVLAVKWPEPDVPAADTMAEVAEAIREGLDAKD
jgi:thiol-disulfide isomerase/thioredoxin/outer membrane lipoprotein-sorting protein